MMSNYTHDMYDVINDTYGDDPQYTITLKMAYEKGLTLWDKVNVDLGDNALNDEFKRLFDQHYYAHEIGQSTWGAFVHYIKDKLDMDKLLIQRKLTLYNEMLTKDPYLSQRISTNTTLSNLITTALTGESDSVFNETGQGSTATIDEGYMTNQSKTGTTNNTTQNTTGDSDVIVEGFTQQEIDLLENYSNKVKDILGDYVLSFRNHFMLVL